MTTAPRRLGLWERDEAGEWQPVGASDNEASQWYGRPTTWTFDGLVLHGRPVRACLLAQPGQQWETDSRIGCRVADSDGGVLVFADGSTANKVPEITMEMEVDEPRFASAAHEQDTTAHLTTQEHAGLAELLAHKDELLALVTATPAPAETSQPETVE